MEHWTANPRQRAAFHAWLRDVNQFHAVNMTYEGVKRHALKVNHLAEYAGTFGQAQKAVLDWIARLKADAGNPVQIGLFQGR